MKPKLAEYLMSHGVLKNADAQTMAQEIIDMLINNLIERNHELEQKELLRSASRPAEAEAMRNVLEESKRLREQLEAVQSSEDSCRRELVAHREKAHGNYWGWQGDGEDHLESLTCPVLIPAESLRKILAQLEAVQKACAAVRQYSQKVSAVGYKEGVVGSDVQMLLGEHGKGWHSPEEWDGLQKANAELREFALTHFSREQVRPLVEALHVIGHSNHNLECPNCPVCTAVEQALAHARAVGMEEI